jgi:hypothetical protein
MRNTTFQSQEDPANEAGADEILFVAHRALADAKEDRDELLYEIAHCKSMLEISRGQVVVSSQELHTARNALFTHEILVEAQTDRKSLVYEMAHVKRMLDGSRRQLVASQLELQSARRESTEWLTLYAEREQEVLELKRLVD